MSYDFHATEPDTFEEIELAASTLSCCTNDLDVGVQNDDGVITVEVIIEGSSATLTYNPAYPTYNAVARGNYDDAHMTIACSVFGFMLFELDAPAYYACDIDELIEDYNLTDED